MTTRSASRCGRVLLVCLLFVGCGSDDESPVPVASSDPAGEVIPEVTLVVRAAVDDTGPAVSPVASGYDLDPIGVLLAALLLASGDVEEAVAAGLLRPVEVDVALLAISSGTIDDWIDFLAPSDTGSFQARPAMRAHSSRRPTVRWNSSGSRSS